MVREADSQISQATSDPKESRRWLIPRVPREQLYRLAPARPRRSRLGLVTLWDRVRRMVCAWWAWIAFAILLAEAGKHIGAVIAGAIGFLFYHVTPESHPAVYALEAEFSAESAEFRSTMAGATGMPLVEGNRVEILNNGDEFYPEMLDAIENARVSITMEQYIFWDGEVGLRFAEALAGKARAGIPVKLLLDAIGSAVLGSDIFEILAAGGCEVAWFHPIHWYTLHRANCRDHRKSLIVDGRVAFTGGSGIADHWLGHAAGPSEWRDVQIMVEGPAVLAQQTGFVQNWLVTTGEILGGHRYFPEPRKAGPVAIRTILSSPSVGAGAAGTMYLIALQCARRSIRIANPYFIPDSRVIAMLARAVQRGVAVQIMLAGRRNDSWWARENSLRLYRGLLEAGVEIYEYQPTMLHQKTMVIDSVWATVGTTNFDNRSFALSEETNICFEDPRLVAKLEQVYDQDLAACVPVRLDDWKRRGLWQEVKEGLASLIEEQM